MNPKEKLISEIKKKKSYLCVGLDTDINKIPKHLLKEPNPILQFNKSVIDSTKNYCVSYKINTAFYEQLGSQGWDIMQETCAYIPQDILAIADAKRGDIGNTALYYAKTFFETYSFDALTLSPYMGMDTLEAYAMYPNKWSIVLGLTSNSGSRDYQKLKLESGKFVYQEVIEDIHKRFPHDLLMFVVGATHPTEIKEIRNIAPNRFFLVPGVGAQGGDLQAISVNGFNDEIGLLVNVSRSIIYADSSEDFGSYIEIEAQKIQREMANLLENNIL